jgi:hypothetical protein
MAYLPMSLPFSNGIVASCIDREISSQGRNTYDQTLAYDRTLSLSHFFSILSDFKHYRSAPQVLQIIFQVQRSRGKKKEKIKIHFTKMQTPFFSFVFILISLSLKVHNFLISFQIE